MQYQLKLQIVGLLYDLLIIRQWILCDHVDAAILKQMRLSFIIIVIVSMSSLKNIVNSM